jgi:hypothetical protein
LTILEAAEKRLFASQSAFDTFMAALKTASSWLNEAQSLVASPTAKSLDTKEAAEAHKAFFALERSQPILAALQQEAALLLPHLASEADRADINDQVSYL